MMQETKRFIVDENGEKTAVILPIDKYNELLGDIEDLSIIAERRGEPTKPLEVVKERLDAQLNGNVERRPNQYTAIIRQDSDWWIGWIEEVPAVICQEGTREKLLESLRVTLNEMLELYREEALVDAGEDYVKEPIVV